MEKFNFLLKSHGNLEIAINNMQKHEVKELGEITSQSISRLETEKKTAKSSHHILCVNYKLQQLQKISNAVKNYDKFGLSAAS